MKRLQEAEAPAEDASTEEALKEAKVALLAAFAHEEMSDEQRQQLEVELNACEDLSALTMAASTFIAQEGLELDLLAILRNAGVWEDEAEGVIVGTGTVATDLPPEEMTAEKTRRMAILIQYLPLISRERADQLLETNFMEDDSLELNIYRSVVCTMAEALFGTLYQCAVDKFLEISGKSSVSKAKQKELEKIAKGFATETAKEALRLRGIDEPSS